MADSPHTRIAPSCLAAAIWLGGCGEAAALDLSGPGWKVGATLMFLSPFLLLSLAGLAVESRRVLVAIRAERRRCGRRA